ncbi:MAG: YidC/Oxa1 family membrane protein insertase [bacterium]|nr:YidC/Oxa1 family membrane protein insertase [bacterium]
MIAFWNSFVYAPLYNVLILLVGVLPGHSVGGAIILLTLIVKLALYPLTGKSIRAQRAMKELEPELKKIREKHKDDRQMQSKKTMELYQERGVSPFSGCLPVIIQIPIILALYWVFFKGLAVVNAEILYGFVQTPETLDMHFLFFDLAAKSVILALLAGASQYVQTGLSLGKQASVPASLGGKATFQEDFAKSMQLQMRYILPVMIGVIAYTTSAAVALYWATSNILSIVQELQMRRKHK